MKRICSKCKVEKPLTSEFFTKDKYDKSGYTYQCKKCRAIKHKEWVSKNPEKVKQLNEKHRETRKEYYNSPERKLYYRKKLIERTFKISYEEYEKMQNLQNNKCAICLKEETSSKNGYLSVDHCHKTGKVRQLLCSKCNAGIGFLQEDINILNNAINYLKKHEHITTTSS